MKDLLDILVIVSLIIWVITMIAYDDEPYSPKNAIKKLLSRIIE